MNCLPTEARLYPVSRSTIEAVHDMMQEMYYLGDFLECPEKVRGLTAAVARLHVLRPLKLLEEEPELARQPGCGSPRMRRIMNGIVLHGRRREFTMMRRRKRLPSGKKGKGAYRILPTPLEVEGPRRSEESSATRRGELLSHKRADEICQSL